MATNDNEREGEEEGQDETHYTPACVRTLTHSLFPTTACFLQTEKTL